MTTAETLKLAIAQITTEKDDVAELLHDDVGATETERHHNQFHRGEIVGYLGAIVILAKLLEDVEKGS